MSSVEAPIEPQTYRVTPEGKRTAVVLLIGVLAIFVFAIGTIVTLFDGGLQGAEWVTALLLLALALVAPLVAWNLLEERAATISTDATGLTFKSLGGIELIYPWSEVRGLRDPADRRSRLASFLFDDTEQETTLDQTPASGANRRQSDVLASNTKEVPAQSANEEAAAGAAAIGGTEEGDDEVVSDDDRETLEIAVSDPGLQRIANPLLRALHQQAHGRFLPIYPGIENRDRLLAEIASRAAAR